MANQRTRRGFNLTTLTVLLLIFFPLLTKTVLAQCYDAYFIGVHGVREGPDLQGNTSQPWVFQSATIQETWKEFTKLAAGKNVTPHDLGYPTTTVGWEDGVQDNLLVAKQRGVLELDQFVRETVLTVCKNPKIILVGYSLGAWVINQWLTENPTSWKYITGVELYGDPLWYRFGPAFLTDPPDVYKGLARHVSAYPNPYENSPQGPGGKLSERWQSRCLVGDPVCGEGYGGWDAILRQSEVAQNCIFCWHSQYYRPATGLTTSGAKFLALKTFPEIFATGEPNVAYYETFVEGDHVYIRLYYNGAPTGVGFEGANGAGWVLEEHSFSNLPYWARYRPGFNRVDYPFNHLCSTQPKNESDIDAWVYATKTAPGIVSTRRSTPVRIHLACSAPKK